MTDRMTLGTGALRAAVLIFIIASMSACDDRVAFEQVSPVSVALAANENQRDVAQLERGKYLVTIAVCVDCHTPFKMGEHGPEPDLARFMSGHPQAMKMPTMQPLQGPWIGYMAATNTAFAGPWGTSYAANLTPDRQTGLGIWTEEMFIMALRQGKHMGVLEARPIMPPMPWQMYSHMTDDDLKAVFAYLQSIPAIENQVPDYELPGEAQADGYEAVAE